MKNVLIINSSPNAKTSLTRQLVEKVQTKIKEKYTNVNFTYRDLVESNLPHIDGHALEAIMTKEEVSDNSFNQRSLALIEELKAADTVVIAVPMYNFGVPSNLKAWVDHVARAGKTFSYSPQGPVGHLKGKQAILVTSAAGIYSVGDRMSWDFSEPYMKRVLNFMGVEDIQVVRIEGLAIPDLAPLAIPNAEKHVKALTI